MAAAIFLKNAYSSKAANIWQNVAKIKNKEVEQTLSPCESIDRYLANENATHHSSTTKF